MVGPRFKLLVCDSQLLSCFSTYIDILYIKLKLKVRAINDVVFIIVIYNENDERNLNPILFLFNTDVFLNT